MAEKWETDLDAALGALVAEEVEMRPRVRPELVARVLADAAEAAARPAAPAAGASAAAHPARDPAGFAAMFGRRLRGPRLAALTLAISLAGGVGMGYATAPEPADPLVEALGELGMPGGFGPGHGHGDGIGIGSRLPF